jgi:hypothetical protein
VAVRFHLVTGLAIRRDELEMSNWVTPADLASAVMPELNRIWRPAGIAFELEQAVHVPSLHPAGRSELIAQLAEAQRDMDGHADPRRVRWLGELLDFSQEGDQVINVHLVPYLGQTSQGVALPRLRRVLVGEWTDKPSRARLQPERCRLVEEEPFRQGSLSRTLAHELGHVLGLGHPERSERSEHGRLMGGYRHGYHLTEHEIQAARRIARSLRHGSRSPVLP